MATPDSIKRDAGVPRRARAGGRRARLERGGSEGPPRTPYLTRRIPPYDLLDEEALALVERNADILLRDVGMEFRGDPEILDILRQGGAEVEGERARFEPGMCRSIVRATAPGRFAQRARNPANSVEIGGDATVLCPAWGPPFVHDLDRGRRYASIDDYRDLIRLHHAIPWLHHSGGVVCEPVDLPPASRHLEMQYSLIRWSDRAYMGAFLGAERARDSIAMAQIVFGEEELRKSPALYCVSNTNAPLVLDSNMSGALKTYARAGQPVACAPWVIAGAMGPCTAAGTLAQLLAEAMACLALVQMVNPGAPCLMGSFASTMSMRSGAPTFGTPEAAQMALASGQLARRLGVPLHTVGSLSASKVPDAQSQQEATMGLTMAMMAGANVVNHATGWLEGGLVTGYEKTVIDADLCGRMIGFCQGMDLSENAQAMDAIRGVGPGSNFLGCEHTQENFRAVTLEAATADCSSYEQWMAEGGLDAAQKANAAWKRMLESYEDPGLDPGVDEALREYVARRTKEWETMEA